MAASRSPMRSRMPLGDFLVAYLQRAGVRHIFGLPGGPGERAGLKSGDVILSVGGKDVADRRSLYQLLWAHRPGDAVSLKIFRGRETRTVTVASGDVEKFFS